MKPLTFDYDGHEPDWSPVFSHANSTALNVVTTELLGMEAGDHAINGVARHVSLTRMPPTHDADRDRDGPAYEMPEDPDPAGNSEDYIPATPHDEAPGYRETAADVDPAWGEPSRVSRLLWDVEYRTLVPPLVPPFLAAEGWTILYAKGGTGKGFVALWLLQQLVRLGFQVAIIDFENHENEWRRRAQAMGFTRADQSKISYIAPFSGFWEGRRGSLVEIAPRLREDFNRPDRRIRYAVVDSFTQATTSADSNMGGVSAANEFFEGTRNLGCPGLVLAHVRSDAERFPERPFGSVHVHNGARETWAAAPVSDESESSEESGRLVVEMKNQKRSEGEKWKPHEFFTFEFDREGKITTLRNAPISRKLSDAALGVLTLAHESLTSREIARAINANEGRTTSDEAVRKAVRNDPRFAEIPGKKGFQKWTLK